LPYTPLFLSFFFFQIKPLIFIHAKYKFSAIAQQLSYTPREYFSGSQTAAIHGLIRVQTPTLTVLLI
jgi:hypothetical protein